MEQDKRNMKLKLQTDAEKDLDLLRNRLEADRQATSTFTIEQRKVELLAQKDVKVMESKEAASHRLQQLMDQKRNLHDMQLRNLKKETEARHE